MFDSANDQASINYNPLLSKRICPHRGIGEENTLASISNAIKLNPFFVEFDVTLNGTKIVLGHPPIVNTETLEDAIALFRNADSFPKIDLRLEPDNFSEAIDQFIACLKMSEFKKALVNLGGNLSYEQFIFAEKLFSQHHLDNVFLNVDLARYGTSTEKLISQHIDNLNKTPFSISPRIDSDILKAISFAKKHQIQHIHIWADEHRQCNLDELNTIYELVIKHGLEVYFDICLENIK